MRGVLLLPLASALLLPACEREDARTAYRDHCTRAVRMTQAHPATFQTIRVEYFAEPRQPKVSVIFAAEGASGVVIRGGAWCRYKPRLPDGGFEAGGPEATSIDVDGRTLPADELQRLNVAVRQERSRS